jgi:hypothetical protein
VIRATSDPQQRDMAVIEEMQPSTELDVLLARALPSPRYIRSGGAAAVVALTAHSKAFSTPDCCC